MSVPNKESSCNLLELVQSKDWREVMTRLKTHPEEGMLVDSNGDLPLHTACRLGGPGDVIEKLYGAHPAAAQIAGAGGVLPLHLMNFQDWFAHGLDSAFDADGEVSVEILRLALMAYPAAASTLDDEGNTVLHAVCRRRCTTTECLTILLSANCGAARVTNKAGKLPLHLACEAWAPFDDPNEEKLMKLLAANRSAANVTDNEGRFPLHLFCVNCDYGCIGPLEALLEANPDSVHAVDNYGRDALFYAANGIKDRDDDESKVEKLETLVNAIYRNSNKPHTSLFVHKSKLVEQNSKIESLTVGLAEAMGNLRKMEKELAELKQASGIKRKTEEMTPDES